jgi:hypothetical protein
VTRDLLGEIFHFVQDDKFEMGDFGVVLGLAGRSPRAL